MALPPILSSLPILKLFGADRAQRAATGAPAGQPQAAQDTVRLSETAQGIPQTDAEARKVAADTGAVLAQGGYSLGLDADFAA